MLLFKKSRLLLTFIFCVSIHVFSLGQTFTPTVIASAGEVYTNSQGSLSVTIGEMSAVETFQNVGANLIINQGFQQYEQNRTVPLKFISFIAKRLGKDIPITWKVAEVVNIVGFDLERSFDGNNFSFLNNKTVGNASEFTFKDNHPQKAWYRVKVNEACGSSWYSWIESVNALPLNVNIYPNPTANKINIVFNANEAGSKVLKLIDIQGKTMLTKSIATQLGNNIISIDISSLSNGTYLLTGLTENGNIIIKQ
jgi:hypothetical protein